jgi:predicted acetyltransferase
MTCPGHDGGHGDAFWIGMPEIGFTRYGHEHRVHRRRHYGRVPKLIDPTPMLRESFLAAVAEFRQDHSYPVPWFVTDVDPLALTDVVAFEAYVARVVGEREEVAARAIGFVQMTTLWWADGEQMLGRLAIRHRLTPALERAGGHIGYDVRPSARRKGHATAMLAAGLPIARSVGIAEALLTCDDTNTASQRVIEGHGGRFIGMVGRKRRYLAPTG